MWRAAIKRDSGVPDQLGNTLCADRIGLGLAYQGIECGMCMRQTPLVRAGVSTQYGQANARIWRGCCSHGMGAKDTMQGRHTSSIPGSMH